MGGLDVQRAETVIVHSAPAKVPLLTLLHDCRARRAQRTMTRREPRPTKKRGGAEGSKCPSREEIWPIEPDKGEFATEDNEEAITQGKINDMWAAFLEALALGPRHFFIPAHWPIELQEYLLEHGFRYENDPTPRRANK